MPAEQRAQADAPVALLYEPGAHGVGFTDENGHEDPAGHKTGAPEEQKYPAAQGARAETEPDAVLDVVAFAVVDPEWEGVVLPSAEGVNIAAATLADTLGGGDAEHQNAGKVFADAADGSPGPAQRGRITTAPCAPATPTPGV